MENFNDKLGAKMFIWFGQMNLMEFHKDDHPKRHLPLQNCYFLLFYINNKGCMIFVFNCVTVIVSDKLHQKYTIHRQSTKAL